MKKVVVLNEVFMSESHLANLREVAEVAVYKDTATLELARERLEDAQIAVVDSFVLSLDEEFFSACSHLELVVISSTGYDKVDLQAATRHGVKVGNTPNFCTNSVAELNLVLIFALARKLFLLDESFRAEPQIPDCYPFDVEMLPYFGMEVEGKTLGSIGFGNIGQSLAKKANALGMKVLVCNRNPMKSDLADFVDMQSLLRESDFVTVNIPLNDETRGMIGLEKMKLMKKTAYLINTGRAGIVCLSDLVMALEAREIAGVGLDVIEPLPKSHPLLKYKNVVFSWHSGSLTTEASMVNLPRIITETVVGFIDGKPVNLLN